MAVTNSYMLPHGTRCSESPRVRIPRMWVMSPSTVRASAARIHGPAGAPPARHRLGAPVPAAPLPRPAQHTTRPRRVGEIPAPQLVAQDPPLPRPQALLQPTPASDPLPSPSPRL